MSVILITHNFGIVSDFADDVVVMFRGEIVESGPARQILEKPQHPYTRALIGLYPANREKPTAPHHDRLRRSRSLMEKSHKNINGFR